MSLLEDAGLGPEAPGERALAFPCRNAPVDVLLVRAADGAYEVRASDTPHTQPTAYPSSDARQGRAVAGTFPLIGDGPVRGGPA